MDKSTNQAGRKLTARQIFNKVYNGNKNFMCPNRLKCFKTRYHAIELSQGRGIYDQNIYGVTVIDLHTMESCKKSTSLYQTLTSAMYAVGRIQDNDRLKVNQFQLWCTKQEESTIHNP